MDVCQILIDSLDGRKYWNKLKQRLSEVGNETDCHYMAVKYYAPIFFFAQRWLFSGTLSEDRKKDFLANAYKHTRTFFMEMGKN